MFGDYWVEVRPEEYVLDVSEGSDRSLCIFAISKNSEDFNILGLPLLMDYYSIFNMEEGTIGFAPHSASPKSTLERAKLPSSKLSSAQDAITANIVAWSIVALLAGGAAAAYYFLLMPFLEDKFPDNSFSVIGLSTAYFVVVALFLCYGIRILIISLMTVSPTHGGLATPENQRLLNVGTFLYLAAALWLYTVLLKSFKAKLDAKRNTSSTAEANPDEMNRLLQLVNEVQ